MDLIKFKTFRFIYTLLSDEFAGSQALKCFESAAEVVCGNKISKVNA